MTFFKPYYVRIFDACDKPRLVGPFLCFSTAQVWAWTHNFLSPPTRLALIVPGDMLSDEQKAEAE